MHNSIKALACLYRFLYILVIKHLALLLMFNMSVPHSTLWGFCIFWVGFHQLFECLWQNDQSLLHRYLLLFSFITQSETSVSFKPSYIWFWLCLDHCIDQVEIAEAVDLLGNTCFSKNTSVDNKNSEANVGINRCLKVLHTEKENNKLTEKATNGLWSGDI